MKCNHKEQPKTPQEIPVYPPHIPNKEPEDEPHPPKVEPEKPIPEKMGFF